MIHLLISIYYSIILIEQDGFITTRLTTTKISNDGWLQELGLKSVSKASCIQVISSILMYPHLPLIRVFG